MPPKKTNTEPESSSDFVGLPPQSSVAVMERPESSAPVPEAETGHELRVADILADRKWVTPEQVESLLAIPAATVRAAREGGALSLSLDVRTAGEPPTQSHIHADAIARWVRDYMVPARVTQAARREYAAMHPSWGDVKAAETDPVSAALRRSEVLADEARTRELIVRRNAERTAIAAILANARGETVTTTAEELADCYGLLKWSGDKIRELQKQAAEAVAQVALQATVEQKAQAALEAGRERVRIFELAEKMKADAWEAAAKADARSSAARGARFELIGIRKRAPELFQHDTPEPTLVAP